MNYSSRKFKRIVSFILGGEVYAFAKGFDRAFIIQYDLEKILKCPVPLIILTESLEMFDVITIGSTTTEKQLMVYVASAHESYNKQEIFQVGLISSEHNVADILTKSTPNAAFDRLIRTGVDDNSVICWIVTT